MSQASVDSAVQITSDEIVVIPAEGVELTFARQGEFLLGLNRAVVDGVELSHSDTLLRPVLAQTIGAGRQVWPLLRFEEAKEVGGVIELHCQLVGFADEATYRREFVFGPDHDRLLREHMTDELRALKQQAESAEQELEQAVADDPTLLQLRGEMQEQQTIIDKNEDADDVWMARDRFRRAQQRYLAERQKAWVELCSRDKRAHIKLQSIERWQVERDKAALEVGDILRDHYEFPFLQQPEQSSRLNEFAKWAMANNRHGQVGGKLIWRIEPVERNIAGWCWRGWSHSFEFELPADQKVNALWQVGTWELDGSAVGVTSVSLRYRGLGEIEQEHAPQAGQTKQVSSAWTTTEIMPGAAGGAPVVSPAIPSGGNDLTDRGFALRHRVGAWIVRLVRGAGVPWMDYQFKSHAAFTTMYERACDVRAVTEVFPGDEAISHTDEHRFAMTSRHRTEPQLFLALVDREKPFTIDEQRTRWKEVDQYVRDVIADELGFVQPPVRPSAGYLLEIEIPQNLEGITQRVEKIAEQGVRMLMIHNPGWMNHRFVGPDGPKRNGGSGICSIYDWRPTSDAEKPWRDMYQQMVDLDMKYYTWFTGMVWKDGPFAHAVGREKEHWGLNLSGNELSNGYNGHINHNILNPRLKQMLEERMFDVKEKFGYDGFWADSYQNLFMSNLDWGQGTGAPMQRAWWELLADWSRRGIELQSESHAMPGLSCSIEIDGWKDDYWYMQHVVRWYRTGQQDVFTPEQRDRILFEVMANKGWTAPDLFAPVQAVWLDKEHRRGWVYPNDVIPRFEDYAKAYLQAMTQMDRPYVLPDGAGVLWLEHDAEDGGAYFCLKATTLPEGVTAERLTHAEEAVHHQSGDELKSYEVYQLKGDSLLKRFGIRVGPMQYPRVKSSQ